MTLIDVPPCLPNCVILRVLPHVSRRGFSSVNAIFEEKNFKRDFLRNQMISETPKIIYGSRVFAAKTSLLKTALQISAAEGGEKGFSTKLKGKMFLPKRPRNTFLIILQTNFDLIFGTENRDFWSAVADCPLSPPQRHFYVK